MCVSCQGAFLVTTSLLPDLGGVDDLAINDDLAELPFCLPLKQPRIRILPDSLASCLGEPFSNVPNSQLVFQLMFTVGVSAAESVMGRNRDVRYAEAVVLEALPYLLLSFVVNDHLLNHRLVLKPLRIFCCSLGQRHVEKRVSEADLTKQLILPGYRV